MNLFKSIPFLRILLPFVAGILVAVYSGLNYNFIYWLAIIGGLLGLIFFLKGKIKNNLLPKIFLFSADIFMVVCGLTVCYYYRISNSPEFYGNLIEENRNYSFTGRVTDLVVEKEKTFKVELELRSLQTKKGLRPVKGTVYAYVKKPFDKTKIGPGTLLSLNTKFSPVDPPLNPDEFDYKRYLADKNIFHVCFADEEHLAVMGYEGLGLKGLGLRLKKNTINVTQNSGLHKEASAFCSALLTGYDDEISPETINAFAHSGTLHILSVSGWHTGVLYIVLIFLFNLIDPNNRFKILRLSVILITLFLFTLLTGFSAPVMRAALMLAFLSVGKFYFNYSADNNMNILSVSAFILLFIDPFLIRNAGFLLSYSAIIGIIYFEPLISKSISTDNRFLRKIWQLNSVSVAAQLSTLPITLFLFHQFPFWFFLSNLLIIPLCSVIIYLSLLLLLKMSFLAPLINGLVNLILLLVGLTNEAGWGYADKIDFSFTDALFLTGLLFSAFWFIKKRSFQYAVGFCFLLLVWQCLSLIDSWQKKSDLSFNVYAVNKQNAFELKNRNTILYSSSSSQRDYDYHIKPHHSTFNYSDHFESGASFFKIGNTSLFHLSDPSQTKLASFLSPQYLMVSQNTDITEIPPGTKLLIADASNSRKHLEHLKELCAKFAVEFYSIKEKGFLSIKPQI